MNECECVVCVCVCVCAFGPVSNWLQIILHTKYMFADPCHIFNHSGIYSGIMFVTEIEHCGTYILYRVGPL